MAFRYNSFAVYLVIGISIYPDEQSYAITLLWRLIVCLITDIQFIIHHSSFIIK